MQHERNAARITMTTLFMPGYLLPFKHQRLCTSRCLPENQPTPATALVDVCRKKASKHKSQSLTSLAAQRPCASPTCLHGRCRNELLRNLLEPFQLGMQRTGLLPEKHDLLVRRQALELRIVRFTDAAHHFNCFNLRLAHN